MINALIKEYSKLYKKQLVPEMGWSFEKVSGIIVISKKGELLEIIPYFDKDIAKGKEHVVPKNLIVPIHETKTSGIKPSFLCDKIDYLLGYSNNNNEIEKLKFLKEDEIRNKSKIVSLENNIKKKQEKALKAFNSSKEFHISLLKNCNTELTKALIAFFMNWEVSKAYENDLLTSLSSEMTNFNFIIQIGTTFLHEENTFKLVWNNFLKKNRTEKEKRLCLITGELDTSTKIHGKIKGVAGSQAAGASLISFNENAFDSYNKNGGDNAPIGEKASFAYVSALNYLLNSPKNTIKLGNDTCVFWSESESSEDCESIFKTSLFGNEEEESKLSDLMKKIEQGNNYNKDISLHDSFNILCLSPNNARLSVRFFYRNSFGEILKSISLHYRQLEIQRPIYDKNKYLSLYPLLLETVSVNSKEKVSSPLLAGALLKSVISGTLYPAKLYSDIILRIRATIDKEGNGKDKKKVEKISANKAAIIKAYLSRNKKDIFDKEDLAMSLNENSTNVSYNLGRLFALLENIQEKANPGLNSTIKDRYFNSACATPKITFPIILKLSNAHLKKMDESSKIYFNKQLIDIMSKINEFPTNLLLENQGVFILGYYHQVQKRYEKKES